MNFDRPKLGEKVHIEVESNENIDYFTYQVIAHGKVYHSETVQVPTRKYHVFQFVPTFAVAPTATIIAFYFDGDEIVSARTSIEVSDDLNNYVKLKLSATSAKPGQDIEIDIATGARSYVGLVGVDQSVLLLKQNEDLTVAKAYSEVSSYPNSVHSKAYDPEEPNYYNNWKDFRVIL